MDEDTEVYTSCSAQLNGEVFVFGGSNTNYNKKKQVNQLFFNYGTFLQYNLFQLQVSKVVGCGLKRIGDLNYDFSVGACGTYLFPQERILLCFGTSYKSKCERSVHFFY